MDNPSRQSPEFYEVDGDSREDGTLDPTTLKSKKTNKRKLAKELRNKGKEYVSYATKKVVPGRKILKDRCNGIVCSKFNHECSDFTENDRQKILDDFYGTEALQLQREYSARFVNTTETKRITSAKEKSRRNFTIHYCLPKESTEKSVCKTFFLNTLCITKRNVRTALQKKKRYRCYRKREERWKDRKSKGGR